MGKLFNLKVTPEIIKRYDRTGPRYTSYPTVPVWKERDFEEDYCESLRKERKNKRPISLYIHIPFCRQLCTFCGCNKFITRDQNIVEKYLLALENEISTIASYLGTKKELADIHLGGGTPTFLTTKQLDRILDLIFSKFNIQERKEWSFEADPRVTTTKHLEVLYKLGFTRVSFGVQDLNKDIQRAINRNQTSKQSWETLDEARNIGYKSVNLDLVYGLPLQTHKIFRSTIKEVIKMHPDRLAIYSFAFLPGMFQSHRRAIKLNDLPSPEEKIKIYLEALSSLETAGYIMIGMDHYSLPDDELAQAMKNFTLHRNFMGYTTLHDMVQIGVGVSAISDFGNSYFQNQKNIDNYIKETTKNKLLPRRGIHLDKEDILRRKVIETIMCHGEISTNDIEKVFEIDFRKHFSHAWEKLKIFEEEGLVKLSPGNVKLTDLGRLFMRNVVMPFDRYLKDIGSSKFSNTV